MDSKEKRIIVCVLAVLKTHGVILPAVHAMTVEMDTSSLP